MAHGGQASAAASAAVVAPSITTDVPDTMLVAFYGSATNTKFAVPATMTKRTEVISNGDR